ncbi:uncharacterized protein [Anser cygnoides]|uniref:uncharacterized protein isoform X3 n=1 Tax=Anser cygnoides TaxID=8845 RepID=UPI0020099D30|nr:uncharacterized protein LOC106042289 isoform X3 [Anser cygnoides]
MKENITQKNITRHVTQNISLLLTNKTSTDSQETRVQSFHKEKVAPYQQIMQGYRLYKLMCKEVTLQGILEALLCTRLHLQLSYGSDEASSNQRLLLYGFPESSMISFSSTSTYSFPWLPKKTLFPLRAAHQCITLLRAPLKAEDVLQGHPQLLFMDARQMLLSFFTSNPYCFCAHTKMKPWRQIVWSNISLHSMLSSFISICSDFQGILENNVNKLAQRTVL